MNAKIEQTERTEYHWMLKETKTTWRGFLNTFHAEFFDKMNAKGSVYRSQKKYRGNEKCAICGETMGWNAAYVTDGYGRLIRHARCFENREGFTKRTRQVSSHSCFSYDARELVRVHGIEALSAKKTIQEIHRQYDGYQINEFMFGLYAGKKLIAWAGGNHNIPKRALVSLRSALNKELREERQMAKVRALPKA